MFGIITSKPVDHIPLVAICDQDWDHATYSSQTFYSFEDASQGVTEEIRSQEILENLRSKRYPDPSHKVNQGIQFTDEQIDQIALFSDLISSQLLGRRVGLDLNQENPKNYLLVPMSLQGQKYAFDQDLLMQTINRDQWMTLDKQINQMKGSYEDVAEILQGHVLFDTSNPCRLFEAREVLPGQPGPVKRKHSVDDPAAYVQARVFGKKKPANDGYSLQDYLYLYPTKLALVK